jgi:hypothetical protein
MIGWTLYGHKTHPNNRKQLQAMSVCSRRNPQVIGIIHEQPRPRSENQRFRVAAPSAGDRPRRVTGVNGA